MENLGWFLILGGGLFYLRSKTASKVQVGAPSAQREVDPTRWRHDGEQPIDKTWWEGNVMTFKSSYSELINDLKSSL